MACSIPVPARQSLWVSLEQDLWMCIGMCGSLGLPPSTSGQELSSATCPPLPHDYLICTKVLNPMAPSWEHALQQTVWYTAQSYPCSPFWALPLSREAGGCISTLLACLSLDDSRDINGLEVNVHPSLGWTASLLGKGVRRSTGPCWSMVCVKPRVARAVIFSQMCGESEGSAEAGEIDTEVEMS